ncbi:Histone-lysine N-methyltransferase ASHR2 [Morella rubra]|uniref:Histone-lysine N-methyltransferase ASHR2 n=1 Tax=Morella rubra TaxID=262757 RepID=A0A6A1VIQ3_9ROSI|nr:Histone-lysine N-methyltransferase ASHR2 [Morella rubra]
MLIASAETNGLLRVAEIEGRGRGLVASQRGTADATETATTQFLHALITYLCPPPLQALQGFWIELTTPLLAKDKLNAFGLMEHFSYHDDGQRSVRTYGIYPNASFFNHDYLPNVCHFDYVDTVSDQQNNIDIIVRMIHDVPQGREICLSYFPVEANWSGDDDIVEEEEVEEDEVMDEDLDDQIMELEDLKIEDCKGGGGRKLEEIGALDEEIHSDGETTSNQKQIKSLSCNETKEIISEEMDSIQIGIIQKAQTLHSSCGDGFQARSGLTPVIVHFFDSALRFQKGNTHKKRKKRKGKLKKTKRRMRNFWGRVRQRDIENLYLNISIETSLDENDQVMKWITRKRKKMERN